MANSFEGYMNKLQQIAGINSILIQDERPQWRQLGCMVSNRKTDVIRFQGRRYQLHRFIYALHHPEWNINQRYESIIIRNCGNPDCLNYEHLRESSYVNRIRNVYARNDSKSAKLSIKTVFDIYWAKTVEKIPIADILERFAPIREATANQIFYRQTWRWLTRYIDKGYNWNRTKRALLERGFDI